MKRTLFIIAALFLFLCSSEMNAQNLTYVQKQKVDQLFSKRQIAHFKFKVNSGQEIPQLAKIISIDKVNGMMVLAHANKAQFSRFIKMNYTYTIVSGPQKKPAPKKTTPTKKPVKK